jgi:hypothetical protein
MACVNIGVVADARREPGRLAGAHGHVIAVTASRPKL